jgi:hypothetical protein
LTRHRSQRLPGNDLTAGSFPTGVLCNS